LQQKRIGNYFNDFAFLNKDKLPDEKALTCAVSGNDGLFIAIGGASGNIYILRSAWFVSYVDIIKYSFKQIYWKI